MPLFMDVCTFSRDASTHDLVSAYEADMAAEARFGIYHLRYWVSDPAGKVFCLLEADDTDLIIPRHGQLSSLVAHEIYPVSEHVRR